MGKKATLAIALLITGLYKTAVAGSLTSLDLATQPQLNSDSESNALSVPPILTCIFDHMGLSANVRALPWARAKKELAKSEIDGIFLSGVSELLPGVHSDPIILEKWYRYEMRKINNNLRAGVVRGSEAEQWLAERGTTPFIRATTFEQLLNQFERKRFDYFLSTRAVLKDHINLTHDIDEKFVKYVAKTVTFSTEFIKANQNFLNRFNKLIKTCEPEVTTLGRDEKKQVKHFLRAAILPRLQYELAPILANLIESDSLTKPVKTEEIEEQWRRAEVTPLVNEVLNNEASRWLTQFQNSTRFVGEIFITDEDGRLLATSQKTSDFWQGDEEKVLRLQGGKESFLSDIFYDESSHQFQTQYSQFLQLNTGRVIVVIGITIEELLIGPGTTTEY